MRRFPSLEAKEIVSLKINISWSVTLNKHLLGVQSGVCISFKFQAGRNGIQLLEGDGAIFFPLVAELR